ncbi:MAG TPA: winged helix-turn-helix transcriptional regulator [Thermoplasmatales archaeon]|nr:winged helix-turn-helix transcriptional regulator [Thermoplasmatales archaeon]
MDLLREKSLSTQVLILLEIVTGHHSRLAPIAAKIGITKQAVSDYLKKMREDGLVRMADGEYRATMQGTQFLHAQLLELKRFLESSLQKLDIIERGIAMAGNPIREGDTVGLFMEQGMLTAYSGKTSSSTGVAVHDASPGEEIAIRHLNGMVALEMGTVYMLELPGPGEGGSRALDVEGVASTLEELSPHLVGAAGAVARAVLHKIGQKPDLEFGIAPATVEAAQRGLSVALLGSSDEISPVLSAIEEFNRSSPRRLPCQVIRFSPKTIKKR